MDPTDAYDQYETYEHYNDLVKEYMGSDTGSFMLTSNWIYSYFDYALRGYTLTNLGISSLAVFLILLLLMDMRLAFFIMLIILGIDAGLFGWMYILGMDLNTISFCQLCMAVGLTVDYVIHMVHAVAETKLDKNNNGYAVRIDKAMKSTGGSVMKGALTTFVGATVLAFANSAAFRSFFYLLAGIIVVASAFGLLFAPALMGLMPFIYSGIDELHVEHNELQTNIQEYQGVSMTTNTDVDDDQDDEYADAI